MKDTPPPKKTSVLGWSGLRKLRFPACIEDKETFGFFFNPSTISSHHPKFREYLISTLHDGRRKNSIITIRKSRQSSSWLMRQRYAKTKQSNSYIKIDQRILISTEDAFFNEKGSIYI